MATIKSTRITLGLLIIIMMASSLIAGTQDSTSGIEQKVPEITATRVNPHAPVIDGKLEDPVWLSDKTNVSQNFTMMVPHEGEAPTESTRVAFVYDDDALYVAIWNFDSEPDKIKRQLVRRDRAAEADQVAVMLDPYHDHQTGWKFRVNASGVQRDSRLFGDANSDDSWDAVWESGVTVQPWGWGVEMKIPYHCLRFANKVEHTWGVNVERYISRKQETEWWAFSSSKEGGYVSHFGHLTGLSGINPPSRLELLPYSVARLETEPKSAGNPDGRALLGDAGLDLKYAVASDLILDATLNPDFGQVELDQPVLNLSAYETFFDEKRPFFLESADIFQTNFTLFYSRRIGHAPNNWPDNVDYYTEQPDATTILGAGKLTGRIAERTTIGFLSAYTSSETAKFVDEEGAARSAVVEPRASYNVLRVKQDILKSSHVGFIGTLASQNQERPASTGGIDWNLTTNDAVWSTDAQVIGSSVDNTHTGFGFNWHVSKNGGKHIRGSIGGTIKDPYLDISNLGFTPRNDIRENSIWMQYRTQEPWSIFRATYHNLNGYISFNYAGANIDKGWNYNTSIEFVNGWTFSGGFSQDLDEYSDLETRGNGLWKQPHSWSWWADLNSDPRKPIMIDLNPGSGHDRNGTWWAHYTGVQLRPRTNIEVSFGVNYIRYFGQTRWIDNLTDPATGKEIPIFADLDQDQLTPRMSASVTLTTNLSWQVSARMLLTGLDYSNYRRYLGNEEYAPLGDIQTDGEYDFNYVALNSTMILRWEYQPGSSLYLVWTRSQSDDGHYNNLDLSRDIETAFSSAANNVWLVKVSYWWSI